MSVMQNSSMKLLWTLQLKPIDICHITIQTVCVDFIKSHCFLIHVAILGNSHLSNKVTEKLENILILNLRYKNVVNESFCGACSNFFTWLYPYMFKKIHNLYLFITLVSSPSYRRMYY